MIDPKTFLSDYHHINLFFTGSVSESMCIDRKNIEKMEHVIFGNTHTVRLWSDIIEYFFDLNNIIFIAIVRKWDDKNDCFPGKRVKPVPRKRKQSPNKELIIMSTEDGT